MIPQLTLPIVLSLSAPSWVADVVGVAARATGTEVLTVVPVEGPYVLLTGGGHVERSWGPDGYRAGHAAQTVQGDGYTVVVLPDDADLPDGYGLRLDLLLHELGHVAGRADNNRPGSIMCWSLDCVGGGL